MRVQGCVVAAALALIAAFEAAPSRAEQPGATLPAIAKFGDGLDEWCGSVRPPLIAAICSDRELRQLALERKRALDRLRAKVSAEQQLSLIEEQKRWVLRHALDCGFAVDRPPVLPIPPKVRDCMAIAARGRLEYLQSYPASAKPAGAQPTPHGENTDATATGSTEEERHSAWRAYDAAVTSWIEDHKKNLKGEKGLASAFVRIDPQGHVLEVRITQSSGSTTFDKRVQAMLAEARLPAFSPDQLGVLEVKMELQLRDVRALSGGQAAFITRSAPDLTQTSTTGLVAGDSSAGAAYTSRERDPQAILFKDALLDDKALAERGAYVRLAGVYSGLGENIEMLYPPEHNPLGFEDSIRLMTDSAPRDVREFFYNCRQRDAGNYTTNVCPVQVIGHFGECYLKINSAVTFPCLAVERVELRR